MSITPNRIDKPQVIVVFQPGMLGSFITNILMYQELVFDQTYAGAKFTPEPGMEYNSHRGPYRDMLEGFHRPELFYTKNMSESTEFFSPMRHRPLGIHRVADYNILDTDFDLFFTNALRVVMMPESKDDINVWAERLFYSTGLDMTEDWYYPLFKKKGIKNLPKDFIDKLGIKEKNKYLLDNHNALLAKYRQMQNEKHIFFDPKDLRDLKKVQGLMDDICDRLKITRFLIPTDACMDHLHRNEAFLNKLTS